MSVLPFFHILPFTHHISQYPGVNQQSYYMSPYSPWHMSQMPLTQHSPYHPPPGPPHGPLEAEEAAKAQELLPSPVASKLVPVVEEGEINEVEEPKVISLVPEEKAKEPLRINMAVTSPSSPNFQKRRPHPLDLSGTGQPVPPALPSALSIARYIENLDSVPYPEGINRPKLELNQNAKNGKFR